MKIGLACDHAGFEYKEKIKEYLSSKGNQMKDFGCYSLESVDYQDFAHQLAESIENNVKKYVNQSKSIEQNTKKHVSRIKKHRT